MEDDSGVFDVSLMLRYLQVPVALTKAIGRRATL